MAGTRNASMGNAGVSMDFPEILIEVAPGMVRAAIEFVLLIDCRLMNLPTNSFSRRLSKS